MSRRSPTTSPEDPARRVFERAVKMLESRARSARDLRKRLILKGEPEALVDQAIARLIELRYLDDAAYARMVARGKIEGSGWSGHRLRQELWKRGVDRTIAEDALREVSGELEETQDAQLEKLALKQAVKLRDAEPLARRRRLVAYLARRGYDLDDVLKVVNRVLA